MRVRTGLCESQALQVFAAHPSKLISRTRNCLIFPRWVQEGRQTFGSSSLSLLDTELVQSRAMTMNKHRHQFAHDDMYSLSIYPDNAPKTKRGIPPEQPKKPVNRPSAKPLAKRYRKQPFKGITNFVFGVAIAGVLAYGWSTRNEGHLTAEEGAGYYLGIIGGSMMLVLLLYPLRKRVRSLAWLGRVPSWFRVHMLFGILGPVLVLLHSNFHLGSFNSSVALFSMLTVAGSGLIGRFFYARIHHGLYGRKALASEISQDAELLKELVGEDVAGISSLTEALKDYEQRVYARQSGMLSSMFTAATLELREAGIRRRLAKILRDIINRNSKRYGWSRRERRQRLASATVHLSYYFSAVRKTAQFGFYERLFALWHVLHLPLFYFLILTACIHVVAVHQY
jgi:hypothetical protein